MPLIICPECAENISSEAKQCPHCGFPLKKLGAASPVISAVENATEVTYTPVNTPQRLASGVVLLIVSPFLFMIPCIGWVIGAVMFFAGLGILFARKEDLSQIKGDCPYCMLPIESTYSQKSIPCTHCKQNIIFKKGYFLTTAAATNQTLNIPDRTQQMIPPVASDGAKLKWGVLIAAVILGAIIIVAQIDWSKISPQQESDITPTRTEPKPEIPSPMPTTSVRDSVEVTPTETKMESDNISVQRPGQMPDAEKDNGLNSMHQDADEGTLYVIRRFTVTTKDGLHGFSVGTKVRVVRSEGNQIIVTDEQIEAKTEKTNLTSDLNLLNNVLVKQDMVLDINKRNQEKSENERKKQQVGLDQQRKADLSAYRIKQLDQGIINAEAEIERVNEEISQSSMSGNSGNSPENITRRNRITILRKQISQWRQEKYKIK